MEMRDEAFSNHDFPPGSVADICDFRHQLQQGTRDRTKAVQHRAG